MTRKGKRNLIQSSAGGSGRGMTEHSYNVGSGRGCDALGSTLRVSFDPSDRAPGQVSYLDPKKVQAEWERTGNMLAPVPLIEE